MTDLWPLLDSLFNQALDLELEQRPLFLQQVEQQYPEVYPHLCKLLLLDEQAEGFLDASHPHLFSTLLQDFDTYEPPVPLEQIGPYHIVKELGRGGMGLVYLAQRNIDAHTQQTVALKVIKRGMDSDAIVRRFKQERALLATLDHPHIARLLDGGTTEDGRPYFVMEYIQGQPITTYCDQHKLSVDERLILFETVCEAIQYAHQRLIVHRDLKPSNILVTETGIVKLLDFGIAKVLDEEEAVYGTVAPLTVTGIRPLTPHYASPEQIRGEAITTASDVYVLGVLLYELLVGQRPYTARLRRDLERVIVDQEVTRPSTAVLHAASRVDTADSTWILEARQVNADQLRRRLRGDVDSIVLKALAKDVDRRYGSAQVLASDVRRHLAGLPIEAQPDRLAYRMRKFVQRNRWGVALTAVFLLMIVSFSTLYTVRVTAERNRVAAEAEKTAEIAYFLEDLFNFALGAGNRNVADTLLAKTVLQQAARELKDDASWEDQPEIYALLKVKLGTAFLNLGRYNEAYRFLHEGLAIQDSVLDADDPEIVYTLDLLATYYSTMDSVYAFAEIADRAAQIVSANPSDYHPSTVFYHYRAAINGYRRVGNLEKVNAYLQKAFAHLDRIDTKAPVYIR